MNEMTSMQFLRYCTWHQLQGIYKGLEFSLAAYLFIGLMFGMFVTIRLGISEYVQMFTQINELRSWPVDKACPMPWKDLLSDAVISLA
jgi:hypothetical protein